MADTAAHLVDRVLPEVPVRQWVLTLPYPLRYRCAWNSGLTSEVLRCFLRAVFADYRRRAKRDLGLRGGADLVETLLRSGPALLLTGVAVPIVPLALAYGFGRAALQPGLRSLLARCEDITTG